MPKRVIPAASIIIVSILAAALIFGGKSNTELSDIFYIDAVYLEDEQHVQITFYDRTERTESIKLEILGMTQSYQKIFSGYEFVERVKFPATPANGWKAHPLIFVVESMDGSMIEIKTEVRTIEEPTPNVIYSVR